MFIKQALAGKLSLRLVPINLAGLRLLQASSNIMPKRAIDKTGESGYARICVKCRSCIDGQKYSVEQSKE